MPVPASAPRPVVAPVAEVRAAPQSSWSAILVGAALAALMGTGVAFGLALWGLLAVVAVLAALVFASSERGLLHALVLAPFFEDLGVGPMSIGRVLALAVVVLILSRLVSGRLRPPTLLSSTWLPQGALFLLLAATGLWASSTSAWSFAMGQVALAAAFFAAFALMTSTPQHVAQLLRTYVVGACGAGAVGVAQALTGARAVGLQGDANIFALYQVAALPAVLALMRTAVSGRHRALWAACAVPIGASVIASESRGALVALVATSLVVAATDRRRRLFLPAAVAAMAAIVTTVVLVNGRYSPQRVTSDRASGRLDIWEVAWHAFLEHPLTGLGAGGFKPQSIMRLTTDPGVQLAKSHLLLGDGIEVHDIYLEALAEGGVLQLGALLLVLTTVARSLRHAARAHRSEVVGALLPMLVTYCVAAAFLSVFNSKLLWMLAGLAAGLRSLPTRPPTAAPPAISAPPVPVPRRTP